MSIKDKQLARLQSRPKDFTYTELSSLLKSLGYVEDHKGRSSGSRVAFVNTANASIIRLDKPHPGKELKSYQIAYIIDKLKEGGEI